MDSISEADCCSDVVETRADLNWFPSTSAQSAATLVAITGGYLISKLVQLGSERDRLVAARDELMAQVGAGVPWQSGRLPTNPMRGRSHSGRRLLPLVTRGRRSGRGLAAFGVA